MDRNNQFGFYQTEQPFGAVPQEKNARYFRGRARAALKGNWLMTSVTSFVYTLMQGIGVIGGMIPLFLLLFGTVVAGVLAGDGEMSEDAVIMMIPAMFIGYLLMFVVMMFICAPLTVGYSRVHLDLIDGKPVDIGSIFSYFKKAYWKSVGIYTLLILRVLACMLILFAFIICGAIVGAVLDNTAIFATISLIGCVAFTAALVVVAYRYSLAPYILAEYPEMRATDVMRNSRTLMKGRKWRLFCMEFSFIGWSFVYVLATFITCGVGGMVGQYVLMAYMQTAHAAFYDDVANRAMARETEFPSLDPNDYNVE